MIIVCFRVWDTQHCKERWILCEFERFSTDSLVPGLARNHSDIALSCAKIFWPAMAVICGNIENRNSLNSKWAECWSFPALNVSSVMWPETREKFCDIKSASVRRNILELRDEWGEKGWSITVDWLTARIVPDNWRWDPLEILTIESFTKNQHSTNIQGDFIIIGGRRPWQELKHREMQSY